MGTNKILLSMENVQSGQQMNESVWNMRVMYTGKVVRNGGFVAYGLLWIIVQF